MKDDLLEAMRLICESGEYLQRVHDCLFDDGKETDIEVDLNLARMHALEAARLVERIGLEHAPPS
jgi:transcriptional regulator